MFLLVVLVVVDPVKVVKIQLITTNTAKVFSFDFVVVDPVKVVKIQLITTPNRVKLRCKSLLLTL